MKLVHPIIHLNGTPAEFLLEQTIEVMDKLRDTLRAMDGASPNGRDYYLKDGLLKEAEEQHRNRIQRIRSVLDEYEELAEHIADHEHEKERQRP